MFIYRQLDSTNTIYTMIQIEFSGKKFLHPKLVKYYFNSVIYYNKEKININFQTMIIEESVCFMSCEPFFWQLFLCDTHGINFYLHPTFFSSTEQ
jgi:hypothetical protein